MASAEDRSPGAAPLTPWLQDPAFQKWLDQLVDTVDKAASVKRVKDTAATPSNDVVLGAQLMRDQVLDALGTAVYQPAVQTPKAKRRVIARLERPPVMG